MKTLEQIKNDYAVSVTFKDWEDLLNYFIKEDSKFSMSTIIRHENKVMKIYAMECLKLANINLSLEVCGFDDTDYGITNDKNIIK